MSLLCLIGLVAPQLVFFCNVEASAIEAESVIAKDAEMDEGPFGNCDDGVGSPSSVCSNAGFAASGDRRLKQLLPLFWVHVPKCSSAVLNAVMHLPGVCPGLGTAITDYYCSDYNPDCEVDKFLRDHAGDIEPSNFSGESPACNGLILRNDTHSGIDSWYNSMKGRGVIMLRQPEQRLISGYYYKKRHHGWDNAWGLPRSVREYAEAVQGLAVKMLTRDDDTWYGVFSPGAPSSDDTDLAVQRLQEGFAFVGLTEELALSVCLLHAMFGGQCSSREFYHGHRGPQRSSRNAYDEQILDGFVDASDGRLYDEAVRIFNNNLKLYDVSYQTCRPCFELAGFEL
jgi:hypothetical protein|eukprot:TRINITY_DN63216_c0_g1_i1.p1 TRINITY_DN63216_c0_g1~~TRINITY_DN63216_c0_g1_i1.p1  ORF type:complete len:341 (-),score=47.28 TRINITY_DN63216_c0_g1_i1:91-1113(-)